MNRRKALLFGMMVAAVTIGGWWWATSKPRLNLLLITLDTTRADHLGCYGYASAKTTHLDRLASQGVLFEKAYTAVPLTLPSHATMLTGLLPPEHGARINGTKSLAKDTPTLAAILQKRGYQTGAFVSSLVLDRRFGLSQGFSHYNDYLRQSFGSQEAERSAENTISSALVWLRSTSASPFFCWIHLYDPHEPYQYHPEEFGDTFKESPYDGELAYVDLKLGRLIDQLRQLRVEHRTVIVIIGDHGEGLNEHREATHGFMAYNSTMHVPLIVMNPTQKRGGIRVQEPVSLVDVFPTILDELAVPKPRHVTGRSLRIALKGGTLEERPCYGETEAPYLEGGWSPLRTWTTSQWKFIRSAKSELYDLVVDPKESNNLLSDQDSVGEQLAEALRAFEEKLQLRHGEDAVLNPAEKNALASLGYVGGQAPYEEKGQELRDIKDTIQFAEQAHRCSHLVHQGQADRAQAILEEILKSVPDYAKGWGMLGICCLTQNHFGEAEKNYRRSIELDRNQNFAWIGLGRALLAQHRVKEAMDALQHAIDVDPAAADGQYFFGEACLKSKRWGEAKSSFAAVLKLVPDMLPAQLRLGDIARDTGDLNEALQLYEAALERHPNSFLTRLRIGQLLIKRGQESDALRLYESLLSQNESQPELLTELARFLAKASNATLRNPDRAVDLAEQACKLTDYHEIAPLMALASSYAAQQRNDLALKTAEQGLDLARQSGSADQIAEIEQELTHFREKGDDSVSRKRE